MFHTLYSSFPNALAKVCGTDMVMSPSARRSCAIALTLCQTSLQKVPSGIKTFRHSHDAFPGRIWILSNETEASRHLVS